MNLYPYFHSSDSSVGLKIIFCQKCVAQESSDWFPVCARTSLRNFLFLKLKDAFFKESSSSLHCLNVFMPPYTC